MSSEESDRKNGAEEPKKGPKKRPQINYISSDEEDDEPQPSTSIFAKKTFELKNGLAHRNVDAVKAMAQDKTDDDDEEVFCSSDSKNATKTAKKPNKKEKELREVLKLVEEVQSMNRQRTNQNNDNSTDQLQNIELDGQIVDETLDHFIILDDEEFNSNVAENTRSGRGRARGKVRAGGSRGRGRGRGKTPPNRTRGGRRCRKSLELTEQQAFAHLDGMQALDDVQVIQDLESSMNVSQEIEDINKERDIEIKVKYDSEIKRFSMKSNEKFSQVLPAFAETLKEKIINLVFYLNDAILDSEATPNDIDLKVSDIIHCQKRSNKSISNDNKDPNNFTLKLRDKNMKNAETIIINKFETVSKMIELFAKSVGKEPQKIVLSFDGDRLEPDSIICKCDIEDESQIDVVIK